MKIAAIILIGGIGSRAGQRDSKPKQFFPLGTQTVFEKTLSTFQNSALFSEIIVVTPKNHPIEGSVMGGLTRQQSSYNGILACPSDTDFVVIHDGVRPFVSFEILQRNVDAVQKYHAVNTCIPATDTIVHVKNNEIISIPNREMCMHGQTPQSFLYSLIKEAHEKTKQTNATDDCSLVLELGHKIHVVLGSHENFKITTEQDMLLAEACFCRTLPNKS